MHLAIKQERFKDAGKYFLRMAEFNILHICEFYCHNVVPSAKLEYLNLDSLME
jgi:hypothetical protein